MLNLVGHIVCTRTMAGPNTASPTSGVPRSRRLWGRGIGRGTLPPNLWYGTIVAGPMCVPLHVGQLPERYEHSVAVPSPGGPYALLASGGWCPWGWAVLPVGVALCTKLALLWMVWSALVRRRGHREQPPQMAHTV